MKREIAQRPSQEKEESFLNPRERVTEQKSVRDMFEVRIEKCQNKENRFLPTGKI